MGWLFGLAGFTQWPLPNKKICWEEIVDIVEELHIQSIGSQHIIKVLLAVSFFMIDQ